MTETNTALLNLLLALVVLVPIPFLVGWLAEMALHHAKHGRRSRAPGL